MRDYLTSQLSKVEHSILATAEEVADARRFYSEATTGVEGAAPKLRALSERVSDRERGAASGQLILPAEAEVATPMIAGLETFAGGMEIQLAEQVRSSQKSRRAWLSATVLMVSIAALFAITGAIRLVNGDTVDLTIALVVLAVVLLGCSVVPFRVYQAADVDHRRAHEKQLALKFFVSSIRLTSDGGPAASALSPVLNGALNMFMTHYESTQTALSIRDMVPEALPNMKM